MEPGELEVAKQALRSFAARSGLGWLLEELDEAVTVGVVEVKALRLATRQGRQVYEDVPVATAASRGRRRAEEFLTHRPMTDQEQVESLIRALRRVLIDLDEVAQSAVDQLNELPRSEAPGEPIPSVASDKQLDQAPPDRVPLVAEIDFMPDEGSVAAVVSTEGIRHSEDRRITLERILDALILEARQ